VTEYGAHGAVHRGFSDDRGHVRLGVERWADRSLHRPRPGGGRGVDLLRERRATAQVALLRQVMSPYTPPRPPRHPAPGR